MQRHNIKNMMQSPYRILNIDISVEFARQHASCVDMTIRASPHKSRVSILPTYNINTSDHQTHQIHCHALHHHRPTTSATTDNICDTNTQIKATNRINRFTKNMYRIMKSNKSLKIKEHHKQPNAYKLWLQNQNQIPSYQPPRPRTKPLNTCSYITTQLQSHFRPYRILNIDISMELPQQHARCVDMTIQASIQKSRASTLPTYSCNTSDHHTHTCSTPS